MRIKDGWLLVLLLGPALHLMGQSTLDALRQYAQKGDAAAQLQLSDVYRTGQGLLSRSTCTEAEVGVLLPVASL